MRALQSFRQERPENFGAWFKVMIQSRPLPWSWDEEDAELLGIWYRRFDWRSHLSDKTPTTSGAASVLGVLIAKAYHHCFSGDGDTAVWKPLKELVDPAVDGDPVSRLSKRLGQYQDCSVESDLKHVIPFLRLVGCPPQAMPILGQRLRSSLPFPKKFHALVISQWGSKDGDPEGALRAWLREGRSRPLFLSEAEATLIQQERPGESADETNRLDFDWRCFEMFDGTYRLTLVPTGSVSDGDWIAGNGKHYCSKDIREYGVPQELGRDGYINGPEVEESKSWPDVPTLWSKRIGSPPIGTAAAYELHKGSDSCLVCLPPHWSLDGDTEPEWRWIKVEGAIDFLDPDGNPWRVKKEDLRFEVVDNTSLVGHPEIKVINRLPQTFHALEITGGSLGSSLPVGSHWRPETGAVPPLGHLRLAWLTSTAQLREKEILCLPTFELTRSHGEHPVVWIRGMQKLRGFEDETRWFELPIKTTPTFWKAEVTFEGWGTPLVLALAGGLPHWGARLRGHKPNHPWPEYSPWAEGPGFFMEAYQAGLTLSLDLPVYEKAQVWLEDGGDLWPDRIFEKGRILRPLEFKDPLSPLLESLEPCARPVRVDLISSKPPNREEILCAPLFRFFTRDAWVSVHGTGVLAFKVMPKRSNSAICPEEWVVRWGSCWNTSERHVQSLTELDLTPDGEGYTFHLPYLRRMDGPFFLGLRRESCGHPISIHFDHEGHLLHRVVEAHQIAVQKQVVHAPAIREDLRDFRDQMTAFHYDLAETQDLCGLLGSDKVAHWLGFLRDDFLFSQPWTMGIALRHPGKVLHYLAQSVIPNAELQSILGNLGQSGWSWWLLPTRDWKDMAAAPRIRLMELIQALAGKRLASFDKITNPAARHLAVSYICEEGLFRMLEGSDRNGFLQVLGFPMNWVWEARQWSPARLAQALNDRDYLREKCPMLYDLILALELPQPMRPPRLPHPPHTELPGLPPTLEQASHLCGWASAYVSWVSSGRGSLIQQAPWPEVTPEIFRNYGALFTVFVLINGLE